MKFVDISVPDIKVERVGKRQVLEKELVGFTELMGFGSTEDEPYNADSRLAWRQHRGSLTSTQQTGRYSLTGKHCQTTQKDMHQAMQPRLFTLMV